MPLKEAYFNVEGSGYIDLRLNSRTTIAVYLAIAVLILVIALLNYINLTEHKRDSAAKSQPSKNCWEAAKPNWGPNCWPSRC